MMSFQTTFFAGFAIAGASLAIIVVEVIGTWRFAPTVYRLGLTLQRRTVALAPPPPPGSLIQVSGDTPGLAKVVALDLCLFRSQFRLLGFHLHTPFPLRGSIRWEAGSGLLELRLPIGTSVFMAGWLIAWAGGSFMLPAGAAGQMGGVGMFVLGLAIVVGIVAFSLSVELMRAQQIFEGLAAQLAKSAA